MSGYREHNFDPSAGGNQGVPMRPFNKWQWVGVGFVAAGILVMLAVLAGRLGWGPMKGEDILPVGTALCLVGAAIVGSRREPVQLTPEQSARLNRRKILVIAVALAVCAIVAGAVIYLKGA